MVTNPIFMILGCLTAVLLYFNLNQKQENFIGPIVKPLKALQNFVSNFPVIFGILVDALLNFCLNFVDIMLSLVDVIKWIINVPVWAINGFMFILTAISDLLTLGILWLNPVTMIKGIIKFMIFMTKIIFMTLLAIVTSLGRNVGSKILDNLRNGLWGIPHSPDQHLLHSQGELGGKSTGIPGEKTPKRFARHQFGPYTHHHKHDGMHSDDEIHATHDGKEIPIYNAMRCYKGMGANSYLNIVAIILCPPLGVFMSYGLSGIFKILICAALSLLYYFPGLIYALLITTHLGIGTEIDYSDCGGSFGGLIVEGCPKRMTKTDCESANIPNKIDINNKPLPACIWTPNKNVSEEDAETQGKCFNVHLRYDDYDKLQLTNPNRTKIKKDGTIEKDPIGLNRQTDVRKPENRFNIKGNTRKESLAYQFDLDKYRDTINENN